MRPVEDHLSVNWLEYFDKDNLKERVQCVREAFANKGFGLKKSGRFAVLNVSMIKAAGLNAANKQLQVLHWPDNENNDLSHSGIFNYEINEFDIASEIAASVTLDDILPTILET